MSDDCACNWLQICIRWGLQHGCSVIPKATSKDHILGNLDVLDWELKPEDYEVGHAPAQCHDTESESTIFVCQLATIRCAACAELFVGHACLLSSTAVHFCWCLIVMV